ncbi:calcium-binding protein [Phyllobacterium sp. CCNWLW109]|uniref:calcium-binding protein n=1 Tax=Phyllobacterium sp. CCNWLW109 TaxID=3127479 RepID=UPI0030781D38
MAVYNGTSGIDNFDGTSGADEFIGKEGNDVLNGNGGDDIFWIGGASFGVDKINGGDGQDQIRLDSDVNVNYVDFSANQLTNVESFSFYGYNFNGTATADNFNFSGITSFSSNRYMFLYDGNDSFLGHGGANWVNGGSGDDYINGASGNDELVGAEGNDTLVGGSGDDIFWIGGGGFGIDNFDGGDGSDIIRLDRDTVVSQVDFSANKVKGVEFFSFYGYNFNGTASNDKFDFTGIAEFSSNRYIYLFDGYDSFSGHVGANWVNGGSGNDYINGGAGNDELVGAEGNDTLLGGSGDDIFWIGGSNFGNDAIDGGSGSDIIRLDRDTTVSQVDFSANKVKGVEFFSFYGYDFNGTVNADRFDFSGIADFSSNRVMYMNDGNDTFIGHNGVNWVNGGTGNDSLNGGAGNDELNGAEGDDTLIGGTGADEMTGGAGSDKYYVDNANDVVIETDGPGVDVVTTTVSFSIGTRSIENIILAGTASISASGNSLVNYIVGNAGNNYINAGSGADTMAGGLGNDTYIVDNAGDKVIEGNVKGIDTVHSSVTFAAGGQFIENITLTGASNINASGNALANILTGNGGNNTLNGGTGADTMSGDAGNDKYVVDNVGDRVIEAGNAGTDIVSSSISFVTGGQHIENVLLTGTASINATGNSLANYLVGNAGANILSGGAGNDLLTGGAGSDAFVFNTVANGSTNRDTITDFSAPSDTIWMDNAVFAALGGNGTLGAGAFHIGAGAHDAGDRVIYNSSTGALFYDADGSGSGAAVQFAILGKGLALTNADFLVI